MCDIYLSGKLSRETLCRYIVPLKIVSQSWVMHVTVIKFPGQTEMCGTCSRSLFSHCFKGSGKKLIKKGFWFEFISIKIKHLSYILINLELAVYRCSVKGAVQPAILLKIAFTVGFFI